MNRYRIFAVAALAAAGLALSSCGGSGGGAGSGAPAAAHTPSAGAGRATVDARSSAVGTVLVDSSGRTMYLLSADRPGHRSCSAACLHYWPPVLVTGTPTAGSGVSAKLGTLAVSGGRQLTVDGHPAYTYVGDSGPGQASGQGLKSFGGTWWAFAPDGSAMTGGAAGASGSPSAPSPSGSSGSSGYGGGYGGY